MLVEFDFGNFRSFKEEASFSMEPLSQNGDNINVIGTNLKRIPQLFRTSGIFGANASGKSNILMALKFVAFVVRNSSKSIIEDEFPEEYYALSENGKNVPMTFTIKFIVDSLLYEYSFSLSRVAVEYEKREKNIFEIVKNDLSQAIKNAKTCDFKDYNTTYTNAHKIIEEIIDLRKLKS